MRTHSDFAGFLDNITVVRVETDMLFECAYQVSCDVKRDDSDQWFSIKFIIHSAIEIADVDDVLPDIIKNLALPTKGNPDD